MPTYEYECEKCGDIFELRQKFTDQPLTTHEKCGGAVHRLLSAPALQFKGSGWYVNDYAKGGSSGDNGAKKNEGSDSGSSDSDSSKAKPSESKSAGEAKTTSETKSSSEVKSSSSDVKSSSSDKT
ncbi:MAG: FmdB family zinc ribbon protein [Bryobacteraceae bacterium]